ncbi:hypothetical protein MYAM1_000158 [Malassezia yamatoensis]|uniref:Nucleoporin protein Ndc1-Nup n=1 Tax=Malassezia yamatoensis TaxID=253288 RepID=A0AAJ5YQP6_9BASI|nr:hypothetical protein MYAM1_000158 [Malassezia yamatoensis]
MAPAGESYRNLVKQAMRPRQERILFLTVLATHIVLSCSMVSPRALFHPWALVGSLMVVGLVLLPQLLERRHRLIHSPEPYKSLQSSTRLGHYAELARMPYVWYHMAQTGGAAAGFVVLYAGLRTHITKWNTELAPSIYVASHEAFYVNETLLVAVYIGAWTGALFAWSELASTPTSCWNVPVFDPETVISPESLRNRTMKSFFSRIQRVWWIVPLSFLPLTTYVLFRNVFWSSIIRVVGVDTFLRPYLVPSFRVTFRPMHIGLVVLVPVLMIVVLFTVINTLFDVYWTQPLRILATSQVKDPNMTLIAGLHDPHPFFTAHAFCELARIAMYDKTRRKMLFDDVQRQHGRPIAWNAIAKVCEQKISQLLVNQAGTKVTNETSRMSTLDSKTNSEGSLQATAPQSTARKADVTNVWTALAQPASIPSNNDPNQKPVTSEARVPSSVPGSGPSLYRILRIAQYVAGALLRRVYAMIPNDAKHALVPQTIQCAFTACIPAIVLDKELLATRATVCWAALALEHFVEASLTEDKYGSVQKDISKITQALLRAHQRLQHTKQHVEREAMEADHALIREARIIRGALQQVDADAATFSTSYAPYFHQFQTTWLRRYATLDTTLSHSAQQIVHTFAPYGVEI